MFPRGTISSTKKIATASLHLALVSSIQISVYDFILITFLDSFGVEIQN
jgi:hypothetical protein